MSLCEYLPEYLHDAERNPKDKEPTQFTASVCPDCQSPETASAQNWVEDFHPLPHPMQWGKKRKIHPSQFPPPKDEQILANETTVNSWEIHPVGLRIWDTFAIPTVCHLNYCILIETGYETYLLHSYIENNG